MTRTYDWGNFWILIFFIAVVWPAFAVDQDQPPPDDPVPITCPTCGSEDPDLRGMVKPTTEESARYGMRAGECIMCGDPWHQETAHGQEEEGSEEEAEAP
jgi:hypothetical protein